MFRRFRRGGSRSALTAPACTRRSRGPGSAPPDPGPQRASNGGNRCLDVSSERHSAALHSSQLEATLLCSCRAPDHVPVTALQRGPTPGFVVLMVPDRDQGQPLEVSGKHLEQDVDHRRVCLVENGMVDVSRFEEELARTVNDGFVWQHIRHIARSHLPYPRTDVVVLANMATGLKC